MIEEQKGICELAKVEGTDPILYYEYLFFMFCKGRLCYVHSFLAKVLKVHTALLDFVQRTCPGYSFENQSFL